MKIRSLVPKRAGWREHFLAVAREAAQASTPQASRIGSGVASRLRAATAPAVRMRATAAV
jgi:hypothetical protein